MSTTNPSHLLISRNPRSPAHPQLATTSTSRYASLYSPSPGSHLFPSDANGLSDGVGTTDAALSAPTAHAHAHAHAGGAAGPRSHSAPTLPLDAVNSDDESACGGVGGGGDEDDYYGDYDEEVIVDPTFRPDAELPGRVKVVVGRHEFWCHKEILWFASPFFNALLRGSWAETSTPARARLPPPQRQLSSPTDTDPHLGIAKLNSVPADQLQQGPSQPESSSIAAPCERGPEIDVHFDDVAAGVQLDTPVGNRLSSHSLSNVQNENTLAALVQIPNSRSTSPTNEATVESPIGPQITTSISHPSPPLAPVHVHAHAHAHSHCRPPPAILQPAQPLPPAVTAASAQRRGGAIEPSSLSWSSNEDEKIDAVVELHEESPVAFQDFLFWAYPHLECKVSWTNVEGLLALATKLIVPALQKLCEHFLMTHASGRPVVALALAEQHGNSELYREASRFVLDQPMWDTSELNSLSEQTQLKLSMRRTWFLERLLKLGSIDVKKEYTCRPDCPDPSRCQTQLDEKWRQAHSTVSRYGPAQPSVAFRCLRQLETFPTNPSLVMPHPLCQTAAKSWVLTLFDRMFQPKMVFGAHSPGTEKYWLYINMT